MVYVEEGESGELIS